MKIYCPNLQSFFAVKTELKSRGLIYIESMQPSRGENFIKIDGYFFALITQEEYEKL